MPWDGKTFKAKHNKSLNPQKARKASKIANAIYKETKDEGKAIRIANAQVKKK